MNWMRLALRLGVFVLLAVGLGQGVDERQSRHGD